MQAIEEMLAFYTALGCSVNEDYPGYAYSVVFGDNKINFHTPLLWKESNFSLRGRGALLGCGDFCFVWNGSETALLQLLNTLGAIIEDGPVERIGGRNMGRTKGSSIYTRDPDMNLVGFIMYCENV
jgi:catechol 2,3-dioxygenase-like lactoylglutathione lyase family enzyme